MSIDPDKLIDHADREVTRQLFAQALAKLPPTDMPPVPDHQLECFQAASMTLWITRAYPRITQAGAQKGLAMLVGAGERVES